MRALIDIGILIGAVVIMAVIEETASVLRRQRDRQNKLRIRWSAALGISRPPETRIEDPQQAVKHCRLESDVEAHSLQVLQSATVAFANKAFPGQRVEAKLDHLIEEAKELREAPGDGMEYADVFLLLIQSAATQGITAKELIRLGHKKLEICKTRKWGPPDERGVFHHIEETYQ